MTRLLPLTTIALATSLLATSSIRADRSAWQGSQAPASRTQVVLLGTGTPPPDPDRSGPATAIVVDDSAYIVDLGPGVVRRAQAAVLDKGIKALAPANIRIAFLTHLHSDHTAGYPDLILTGWTAGRRLPLDVYGPPGVTAMTRHLLEAVQHRHRDAHERRRQPTGISGWREGERARDQGGHCLQGRED